MYHQRREHREILKDSKLIENKNMIYGMQQKQSLHGNLCA